jgi:hypothetical protein
MTEFGSWNAEVGMRKSEVGSRNAEVGMRKSEKKNSDFGRGSIRRKVKLRAEGRRQMTEGIGRSSED